MSRQLRLGISALIALAGLGCGSPTEPALISFRVLAEGPDVDSIAALVLVPAPGQIEVTASMRTPCSSYTATGTLRVVLDTLEVSVLGNYLGDCPFDVIGRLVYRASIGDLAAGEYWVRVRQEWATNDWPTEMPVDQLVRVY